MAHISKALGTVVSAHSRGADSAKGQILLHVMQRNVVDTGTATGYVIEQVLLFSFIFAEVIQGEGVPTGFNFVWHFGDIGIGHDRQKGTKNLLVHDLHVLRHVLQNVQRHATVVFGRPGLVSTDDGELSALCYCVINVALQSGKVSFVKNAGVIGILGDVGIHRLRLVNHPCDQLLFELFGY